MTIEEDIQQALDAYGRALVRGDTVAMRRFRSEAQFSANFGWWCAACAASATALCGWHNLCMAESLGARIVSLLGFCLSAAIFDVSQAIFFNWQRAVRMMQNV